MRAVTIGSPPARSWGEPDLVVQGQWQEGFPRNGAGGVQFAEVEVDTETGFVTVKKILVRAGLRPDHQQADVRKPGQRRHHRRHGLRAL